MTSNTSDTSFGLAWKMRRPSLQWMTWKAKDETDKCVWYCEITKECYLIYKEC